MKCPLISWEIGSLESILGLLKSLKIRALITPLRGWEPPPPRNVSESYIYVGTTIYQLIFFSIEKPNQRKY